MKRRRWLLLGLLYLGLIGGGLAVGHWLAGLVAIDVRPSNEPELHRMVMLATAAYVAASAIPFVPGAEIGFALILVLGTRIVFLVYIAMVAALLLAYTIGRFVPPNVVASAFASLGLQRARNLVQELAGLDPHGKLELLAARAPNGVLPFLLRHRYIALVAAINLPGNTLIGGGGGIAFAAGMSGLFPLVPYLASILIAVAPLPVLILLTGRPLPP